MRGVPIRLEIGGKEVTSGSIAYTKRNDGTKGSFPTNDLVKNVEDTLAKIHDEMYQKALNLRLEHQKTVYDWETFMKEIMKRNICLTPWCGEQSCEANANEKSKEESE